MSVFRAMATALNGRLALVTLPHICRAHKVNEDKSVRSEAVVLLLLTVCDFRDCFVIGVKVLKQPSHSSSSRWSQN